MAKTITVLVAPGRSVQTVDGLKSPGQTVEVNQEDYDRLTAAGFLLHPDQPAPEREINAGEVNLAILQ